MTEPTPFDKLAFTVYGPRSDGGEQLAEFDRLRSQTHSVPGESDR